MIGINQFDGGAVPRFHLARSIKGNHCVFRSDVPAETRAAIEQLVECEPPLDKPAAAPVYEKDYLDLLNRDLTVEAIWRGPAYRIKETDMPPAVKTVAITHANQDLLKPHMLDWLPDIPHREPFIAAVENNAAVAVCASVRITKEAHEAGVETVAAFRRRGYARGVVSAWAKSVRNKNAVPLYSTSWDNAASQAVAASLKLELIGTDFHVR